MSSTTKRQYTSEVKVAAVQAYLEGIAKSQVLEEFGVRSVVSLEEWIRIFKQQGAEGLRTKQRGRPRRIEQASAS